MAEGGRKGGPKEKEGKISCDALVAVSLFLGSEGGGGRKNFLYAKWSEGEEKRRASSAKKEKRKRKKEGKSFFRRASLKQSMDKKGKGKTKAAAFASSPSSSFFCFCRRVNMRMVGRPSV